MTFVFETNNVLAGDETNASPDDNDRSSTYISQHDRGGIRELYMEDIDKARAGSPAIHENKSRQNPTSGPLSPPSGNESTLSLREASLMRYFIQKITPWVSHEPFTNEWRFLTALGRYLRSPISLQH